MPTVRVFEELQIWQLAAAQCQQIYKCIEAGVFLNDRPLSDQINRASGSVMDNIAEGFDRFSKADFRHFLVIARGSNAEVRSQLHRAASRGHLTPQEAEKFLTAARQLGIKINNFISYLDRSIYKYKPKPKPEAENLGEPEMNYGQSDDFFYELPTDFLTER